MNTTARRITAALPRTLSQRRNNWEESEMEKTRMFPHVSGQSQSTEEVCQTHNRALELWIGTNMDNCVLTANHQSYFQESEVSSPGPTWVTAKWNGFLLSIPGFSGWIATASALKWMHFSLHFVFAFPKDSTLRGRQAMGQAWVCFSCRICVTCLVSSIPHNIPMFAHIHTHHTQYSYLHTCTHTNIPYATIDNPTHMYSTHTWLR